MFALTASGWAAISAFDGPAPTKALRDRVLTDQRLVFGITFSPFYSFRSLAEFTPLGPGFLERQLWGVREASKVGTLLPGHFSLSIPV